MLDQAVVLKLLHPRYGADAAFVSRLYLTACAAAALGHPAIAAVYDRGPFDGSTFITGEWFADGNLAALLHRSGPLATRQIVPALGAASSTRSRWPTPPGSSTAICTRAICWCAAPGRTARW